MIYFTVVITKIFPDALQVSFSSFDVNRYLVIIQVAKYFIFTEQAYVFFYDVNK
jgi:hypothetical protein